MVGLWPTTRIVARVARRLAQQVEGGLRAGAVEDLGEVRLDVEVTPGGHALPGADGAAGGRDESVVGHEALARQPGAGVRGVMAATLGQLTLEVGASGLLGLAVPHHRDAPRRARVVRAPLVVHPSHSFTG